jgi:hypothetical protein
MFNALFPKWRARRNLASAFVGEIVAAMEVVAEHSEIRRLLVEKNGGETRFDFREFLLPRLAVYEANASRLVLFNAPLPRELSYFYTRLMALPNRLHSLSSSISVSAEEAHEKSAAALEELTRIMDRGQELLRSFRGFISRKQPCSISRA